uniref:Uncharacterized protein n=1 Tax=Rheinheimera sp. BAL341 TaxID=1708203 RepID=A0A486XKL7_9GAMM
MQVFNTKFEHFAVAVEAKIADVTPMKDVVAGYGSAQGNAVGINAAQCCKRIISLLLQNSKVVSILSHYPFCRFLCLC